METIFDFLVVAVIVLFCVLGLALILAKLYKKSTKEIAFVRTGFGGERVILNGGALVLPIFQDVIPVNMNTLRLEVQRRDNEALITKDRMRVDVAVEFYVRVKALKESIANAAQTLGYKTMEPQQLKELVEGKFVDALRAVAAEMSMKELHEMRVDFVNKVQQSVSEDLLKNGLELESVSLTGLDQTSKDHFNPDNAFDAEGLTRLTQEIEARRKTRNEIELDTKIAIENKNLEAEKQSLEIARESEYARMQQEREVEIRRAGQTTEIAQEKASKQKEAQQAAIEAKKQIDISRISAERETEQQTIEKERLLQEKEIEKRKSLEIAEQDKAIAIAEKSKAQSVAQAEADKARSAAVREEEHVVTVRETERAERVKAVELVEAKKQAERDAIAIEVAAEAQKNAAKDKAEAVRTIAAAEAEKEQIKAKGEAEAAILKAEAAEKRYAVDAAGERALNEARNLLSAEQIQMQIKQALIEQLPEIIRESVKPMEQIDGIKIIQVDGLNAGQGGSSTSAGEGGSGSLADQVVNSALRYRGQAPLLDSLLAEIGLKGSDINGLQDLNKGDHQHKIEPEE
ncbi:MAG: flotillin family protein [Candidatus Electrothrix aestuarii]|uniref:Flotillin family protein n=1 Tax=Candidatus Electrothrix aestuarii TaxID=3062594 RepID=A0AAU8LT87_9BACT|nr:flotillin family protein [Candidatus Electrothrix aestuarii]